MTYMRGVMFQTGGEEGMETGDNDMDDDKVWWELQPQLCCHVCIVSFLGRQQDCSSANFNLRYSYLCEIDRQISTKYRPNRVQIATLNVPIDCTCSEEQD